MPVVPKHSAARRTLRRAPDTRAIVPQSVTGAQQPCGRLGRSVRCPCHLAAVLVRDFQHGLRPRPGPPGPRGRPAPASRRRRVPQADPGRPHRAASPRWCWDDVAHALELCRSGSPVHVVGRYEIHQRWGAQIAHPRRCARRPTAPTTRPSCTTARRARSTRWRPTCASSSRPSRTRTCAGCWTRSSARARETWALYRIAPGGQALPPGLPARAARALPHRRPGRQRDQRDVPGHRPRRRGHRRAAARHRQARGLHLRRADRHDRRRPAAGRDPARLLPRAPRHRGPRRLPRRPRRRPCCTSSSPTTARSSTARPSCPARARRRSCT